MPRTSPIRNLHLEAEAEFTVFPPARSVHGADAEPTEVVGSFGDCAGEIAALCASAGLVDLPHRAVIEATGADRLAFLDRMLTQRVRDVAPGRWASSFWLNRKGRIDADLRVLSLPDRTLIELDAAVIARTLETLSAFIITEDVALRDADAEFATFALIGPWAADALARVAAPAENSNIVAMLDHGHGMITIAGAEMRIARDDALGAPRFTLLAPREEAGAIYAQLMEAGSALDADAGALFRAVGWRAYDDMRVRARAPRFLVDFGVESLPHETGVLRSRVSFTKGCYLGQEIVARMESLGRPKQVLAALALEGSPTPDTGELLYPDEPQVTDAVGVITSVAPARDDRPAVGLAQIRTQRATPGAPLRTAGGVVAHLSELPDPGDD